jgi:hypothetical protein
MKLNTVCSLFAFLLFSQICFSQITVDDLQIKKMITEVKAESLETTVKKLVSFGTRHTLSDTKSKTRGIGAAQQWQTYFQN